MEDHRIFITDTGTQHLYQRALSSRVKEGDVILDLGCGTGIHGLMACQFGARRVFAVETSDIIHVAKEIAGDNGFSDRIEYFQALSSQLAELPEPVDLIVTNQGFPELLSFLPDAANRFLKPGGKVVPGQARMYFAPLEFPTEYKRRVHSWKQKHYSLDFSAGLPYAVNQPHFFIFQSKHLLGNSMASATIDLCKPLPTCFHWRGEMSVSRSGTLHGLGAWFEFDLAPGITLSTAPPMRVGAPPWINYYFPILEPLEVKQGFQIDLEIRLSPQAEPHIWTWKLKIKEKQQDEWKEIETRSHSSFQGLLLSKEVLQRTQPDSQPKLSNTGEAAHFVLSELAKSNGNRTSFIEVEKSVLEKFPQSFPQPSDAAKFVSEIVRRYA